SNLTPSTRYHYSIKSKWKNEYSCNELMASDSTPLNTNVLTTKNNHFKIYPNPTNDNLQIVGDEYIEYAELSTITGTVIRHYNQERNISISDLPSGIYYLRINHLFTYKILKL